MSAHTFANASVHVKDCPNCHQRKSETLRVALPQNILQSIIHPTQCTLLFILTQTTVQDKKWLHAKESHIKWDSESYCSFSENYFVCCCSNRALANVYNRLFVKQQNHKYFQQGLNKVSSIQKSLMEWKCHFLLMENICLFVAKLCGIWIYVIIYGIWHNIHSTSIYFWVNEQQIRMNSCWHFLQLSL